MIGSRQDIAVEDLRPVARKNRLGGAGQLFQNRPQLRGQNRTMASLSLGSMCPSLA